MESMEWEDGAVETVEAQPRTGPKQLTPDEILGRKPSEVRGDAAFEQFEKEEAGDPDAIAARDAEIEAEAAAAADAAEDEPKGEVADEQENLLGEQIDKREALAKPKGSGTAYKVFEAVEIDYEPEDVFIAWREVGAATASTQRAAIIEVVGPEAAGDFMALPASSAQVHPRREKRVFGWDD